MVTTLILMPSRPMTVLILGHSFIRRLRDFVLDNSHGNLTDHSDHTSWSNLKLEAHTTRIIFRGFGGLTITKAFKELTFLSQLQPDVVFIQLGENDVDKHGSCPIQIADNLLKLVGAIFKNSAKTRHVFWGQLLHRPTPRICPRDYSVKIHAINKFIRSKATVNLHYWPHKGLWQDCHRLFSSDGVHLNSRGQHKLARSIRGAILRFKALTAVRSSVVVAPSKQDTRYRNCLFHNQV